MSNKYNIIKGYVILLTLAVLFLIYKVLIVPKDNIDSDILRVKGIIVEDENGKERILIGAPIPFAKNRVRTDTNKVKKVMGEKF